MQLSGTTSSEHNGKKNESFGEMKSMVTSMMNEKLKIRKYTKELNQS